MTRSSTDGWIIAPLHPNEAARLKALHQYAVLDTPPEEAFDRITRMAAMILGTPIALVSLVDSDRQWFKSHHGIDATETPRALAFCAHAILDDTQPLVVTDATQDPRFRNNPLVTGAPDIRFYAGAPLITSSGEALGTLCVIDQKAHAPLTPEQSAVLSDLAALVIDELELRYVGIKAAQANQAKSKFLANMSHEIRTPLNAITGFCNMIRDTSLTEEQKELVGVIHSSSDTLLEIINDVLDISKIEAGKIELDNQPFNPRQMAEEVIRMFAPKAHERNLHLDLTISHSFPTCLVGDGFRLRQVLLNLVSNAIKFTHEGGITIRLNYTPEGNFTCAVRDTGIGIHPDHLHKIFEEFTQEDMSITRRYGGTGLGLSICNRLLVMMDSHLELQSTLNEGSTFSFSIPLAKADYCEILPAPSLLRRSVDAHVLVVEDMEFNQRVARNVLEKMGCTVEVVNSGPEALERVATTAKPYDMIFMDVMMPDMDGLEVTRRIREQEGPLRHNIIVAMTASALNEDREACMKAGMDDFISKPLQPPLILSVLQKFLPVGSGGMLVR